MTVEYQALTETIAATAAAHAVEVDRGAFPSQTLRALGEARASLVMGSTTDVLYDVIGKAVCGLPLF